MSDPVARLLPAGLRAALGRRELSLRRPVAGLRHGSHRSLRPGVGRDFRDYRAYVPGDDPRRLDWRAAGRSQRLVVRQTESEEELDLLMLVDGSGGMDYGEGPARKWTRAGTVVAALTHLALRQGDRVALLCGGGGRVDERLREPAGRRERLRRVAARFVDESPAGHCPWPELLEAAASRLRRRTLVVVLSDFLDPGAGQAAELPASDEASADAQLLRALAGLRSAGHQVHLLQVLHRDELEFPWQGRVLALEDLRGHRDTVEGPAASLREDYLVRLAAHLDWLASSCERAGLDLQRLVSDDDPADQLLELLERLAGARGTRGARGFA